MLFLVIISCIISFLLHYQQCLACLPGGGMFNSYSNPYGYPYNNYLYGNGYPNAIAAPNQNANQSSKQNNQQNAQTAQIATFANAYMYPTTGIAGAFDNIGRTIANVGRAKEMALRAILEGKPDNKQSTNNENLNAKH